MIDCTSPTAHLLLSLSFFLKKWANPGLFFVYIWPFQTNNTILKTNQFGKGHVHPVYGAGIRTHDLQNVSLLPKTTRPWIPPFILRFVYLSLFFPLVSYFFLFFSLLPSYPSFSLSSF